MSETTQIEGALAALRSIRKVATDVLEHPGIDREKALRFIERRAGEALEGSPTPAAGEDVRERVVWLLSQWGDELAAHWEDPEEDEEPPGVGQIADEILALLRTPSGEGEAVAEIETWGSRGPDRGWGYEIRVLDLERLAALPAGRHSLYLSPALRAARRGEGGGE